MIDITQDDLNEVIDYIDSKLKNYYKVKEINMRDIRFRAWDKRDNRMYFSFPNWCFSLDGDIYSRADPLEDLKSVITPLQYTGLKDKKGMDIYEGDVVKTADHLSVVCHGWFKEDDGMSAVQTLYGWYIQDGDWQFNLNEHLEVLGNIYENPELLEKETP